MREEKDGMKCGISTNQNSSSPHNNKKCIRFAKFRKFIRLMRI